MSKGIFWNQGFDLEIYVLEFLHYMSGESDILEDALYDFIYSQNFYLGNDLQMHKYV